METKEVLIMSQKKYVPLVNDPKIQNGDILFTFEDFLKFMSAYWKYLKHELKQSSKGKITYTTMIGSTIYTIWELIIKWFIFTLIL